jgi:putative addiction module killer protein
MAQFIFDVSEEYDYWVDYLSDKVAAMRIRRGIDRARDGNFGNVGSVGGGVSELRFDFGPGYRVYFFQLEQGLFYVLCGGTKDTQERDVRWAKTMKAVKEQDHEREKARARGDIPKTLPR